MCIYDMYNNVHIIYKWHTIMCISTHIYAHTFVIRKQESWSQPGSIPQHHRWFPMRAYPEVTLEHIQVWFKSPLSTPPKIREEKLKDFPPAESSFLKMFKVCSSALDRFLKPLFKSVFFFLPIEQHILISALAETH